MKILYILISCIMMGNCSPKFSVGDNLRCESFPLEPCILHVEEIITSYMRRPIYCINGICGESGYIKYTCIEEKLLEDCTISN